MARKSRKHPELAVPVSKDTVGYIRLSVLNRDSHGSVENQRLMIEEWGHQHQIPIMRYYIDNGFSGKRFNRPAFQRMIQDIQKGKIDCIVVKDLSRLGRDYITAGYYLEMFFPSNNVRFVSINDQFDTTDGITNRDKSAYIQSSTRVPLINLFNEQVSIETKMKVEAILDMKAQHGEFIGPRAPFGYQKSNENPNQLVPDLVAAVIVRKIFEMAASGTGVTGIVRKAEELLLSARRDMEAKDYASANNRAYYAIFHAMRAVLALDGEDFKKHSAVIARFTLNYLKPAILPRELQQINLQCFADPQPQ